MSGRIAMLPEEACLVRAILRRHLPAGTRVFVFGSRSGVAHKPLSDLDLSIEGAAAFPLSIMAELRDAFDESSLPWKVDLIDRVTVSEAFGKVIDKQKLPFEPG